jgi:hypothetical protein
MGRKIGWRLTVAGDLPLPFGRGEGMRVRG